MASTIDDDFAAYVALRWQSLVRTLVLLGCPSERAEEVTRAALAHCHRSWARIRRSDDVDVRVYRRLLRTWPSTRRRHTRRTALVLHSVGGLTEAQVGAVLGQRTTDLDEEQDPGDLLGTDPGTIEVGPPPLDALAVRSTRSRVVRRRALAAVVAVLSLVAAAGLAVVLHDPASAPVTGRRVSPRVELASLPYLTDGVLHVGGVTLPARAVTDLTDPGVGAVYRTQEADIVLVDAEGGTAEIGHNAAPGVVADPVTGRVFWLTYTQQLVVYDAREGHPVATRYAPDALDSFRYSRPLALTGGTAYYGTQRGVRAWDIAADVVTSTGPDRPPFLARAGDLVVARTRDGLGVEARRAGKRLWRLDRIDAPLALVSADASRVLVLPASATPILVDATTGEVLTTGLPAGTVVTAASFTRDGAAAYVLGAGRRTSRLVECRDTKPRCTTVTTVRGGLAVSH